MGSSHRHDLSSSVNSADAESHHGTPDTKSTALSPEDLQLKHFTATRVTPSSNQPPTFSLSTVSTLRGNDTDSTVAGYHDPFVTTDSGPVGTRSTEPLKLSPIAPTFTPLGFIGNNGRSVISQEGAQPINSDRSTYLYTPGSLPSASMVPGFVYDHALREAYLTSPTTSVNAFHSNPTSPGSLASPGTERQLPKSGHFTSDGSISRCVMITQIDRATPTAEIETLISPTKFQSRKDLVFEHLSLSGTVYASFTDIRDALNAVASLKRLRGDWLVQYLPLPSRGLHSREAYGMNSIASKYEGQLLVKAYFSGPSTFFDLDTVSRLILDLLNNYGGLKAYYAIITVYPVVAYRAEFSDTKDAEHAIAHLNGFRIAGCTMSVHRYHEEGPLIVSDEDCNLDSHPTHMSLEGNTTAWLTPEQRSPVPLRYSIPSPYFNGSLAPGFYNTERPGRVPHFMMQGARNGSLLSPHSRQYPAFNLQTPPWGAFHSIHYGPGAIGQERHSPFTSSNSVHHVSRNFMMPRGRHVREQSGGYHNVVDVNRIRQGADVRTTNAAYAGLDDDQIMLRNIPNKINQILRITATLAMLSSISRIQFRLLTLSLLGLVVAAIQGKDCLVQKFRNSSVMLEHHSFRPKIFRIGNDALGGTEEPFPGPDNESKMRRSVENAEHVGLFAPRAGQNFRDEQRRRRSQYDRGTRLAEIEDSYRFNHRFHGSDPGYGYHTPPLAIRFEQVGQSVV
ncbi:MAG: hypothetical protein Q9208_002105 [Pyrenodesmia sp. 3 TL-2023]